MSKTPMTVNQLIQQYVPEDMSYVFLSNMPTVPALSIIRVDSIVLFTPVISSSMFCGHHTSQLLCLKTDTIRKHVSHRNKGKGNFNPSSFTYFRL